MKLHILSDLHFEFGQWPKHADVNTVDADVTLLAGDIGVGLEGLEWALSIKRPVIYVMGNHEFYGQRPMRDLWRKARDKVAGTHVHLLENEVVLLEDPKQPDERVRILGATLWTDFAVCGIELMERCMESARNSMTDYSSIYLTKRGKSLTELGARTSHQGDRLTPRMTLSWHHESRDFLERELRRLPGDLDFMTSWAKTVVVTHHAPSARSLSGQQATEDGDAAYASNLDHLVPLADLWIHGHTHIQADYRIGAGRVISNPRGYARRDEVQGFDPGFVIEI